MDENSPADAPTASIFKYLSQKVTEKTPIDYFNSFLAF